MAQPGKVVPSGLTDVHLFDNISQEKSTRFLPNSSTGQSSRRTKGLVRNGMELASTGQRPPHLFAMRVANLAFSAENAWQVYRVRQIARSDLAPNFVDI